VTASELVQTRAVVDEAVAGRAFPAAVIEVGTTTRPLWSYAAGHLTFDPGAASASAETIFDLASLTKVLSTTPLLMQMVERGQIGLDDPVALHVPHWSQADRADVTIRDLLSHSSGLPAWKPLFQEHRTAETFERAICAIPLDYTPRTAAVYSDLGFMLLGFIIGRSASLDLRFRSLLASVGTSDIGFHPPAGWRPRIAPTEDDPWRQRTLVGEVHDENAWALGGAAGHAGLFGTAASVGDHARHLLQVLDGRIGMVSRSTLLEFVTKRGEIPGSSRALGWDTALPTSSCGSRMSMRAFGHTGFTGTSLWIDPDRGIYVVLLTNRVHPTRSNDAIRGVRPRVHDAVVADLLRENAR
jgi:CubicO group peptidase (beta-lactamase class C family)